MVLARLLLGVRLGGFDPGGARRRRVGYVTAALVVFGTRLFALRPCSTRGDATGQYWRLADRAKHSRDDLLKQLPARAHIETYETGAVRAEIQPATQRDAAAIQKDLPGFRSKP